MADFIYRAVVKNGGESITYRNSKGKNVTYDTDYSCRKSAPLLFNTINKYFTGKSPNITPKEQVQIRADIAKSISPMNGGKFSSLDIYKGIDFVLKTFSDKNSEGGENITPNEVYQMFEIFHNWTKER